MSVSRRTITNRKMIMLILCLVLVCIMGILKVESNYAHAIEILYGIFVTGNVGAKFSPTPKEGEK